MSNWLEKVVPLNVKESSLQQYKALLEIYIETHLGNEKDTRITPAVINKFMRKLPGLGLVKNTLFILQSCKI